MSWLRALGIKEEVLWQEDRGQEFGGDNLKKLGELNEKYYKPFRGRLGRAPKGRKRYQGRAERSHKTDDEKFYLPYLLTVNNEEEFLHLAGRWIFWYNTGRPHYGDKMAGKTPYQKLQESSLQFTCRVLCFPCSSLR